MGEKELSSTYAFFFRAFLSAVRKILFDWAIKKKPGEKIERGGMEARACWFELTGRGFFLWAWSCLYTVGTET